MPRSDMTLVSKIAVLDKIKSQPPNTTYRKLAEITGVPKSTISRLLQQESRLREELVLNEGQAGTSKRKRKGKVPDVEEALNQWFSTVNGQGVNISGPILKAKSEELAKNLGHDDFKANDGWLSRWKVRHNVKLKKGLSEKDESAEQWKSNDPFLKVDVDLPSYDEDCGDSIVESIKREKLDEDEEDEDNLPVPVTDQEARKCIAILQQYFMQEGNEGCPTSALNNIADFVQMKCDKNKIQDPFLQ